MQGFGGLGCRGIGFRGSGFSVQFGFQCILLLMLAASQMGGLSIPCSSPVGTYLKPTSKPLDPNFA